MDQGLEAAPDRNEKVTMNTVLRNLTFDDVRNVKLFTALMREARFRWLEQDDDRYTGLQDLSNDIRESTVNPQMPVNLLRNENEGGYNACGDTGKLFVADAEAWQIIRDWLFNMGIKRDWW